MEQLFIIRPFLYSFLLSSLLQNNNPFLFISLFYNQNINTFETFLNSSFPQKSQEMKLDCES